MELELLFGDRPHLSQADLLDVLDDDPGSDTIDEEIAHLESLYGEEISDEFVADQRGRAREREEEGLGRNEQLVEAVWLELSFRQQVVGIGYPIYFEEGLATIAGPLGRFSNLRVPRDAVSSCDLLAIARDWDTGTALRGGRDDRP